MPVPALGHRPGMARPPSTVDTADLLRAIQVGPVSVASADAAGISRGRRRAAVSVGELTVVRQGFVVPTRDWRSADEATRRTWALQVATEAWAGSFGSHDTAAMLWGLPDYRTDVSGDPPRTHITRAGQARTDGWIRVHGCDTSADATVLLGGVPVTSLMRTAIDMCATRSARSSLVFMDAAMRRAIELQYGSGQLRGLVIDPDVRIRTTARFDGAVAAYTRHRWVRHVRQAIRWADPAAETVLESLSRFAMIDARLPLPRCGVPLVGDDGRTYWVDFYWDEFGLIGEADGLGKYADTSVLLREKRRQESLQGRGHSFVRWGMAEVVPDPRVLVARLRRAMADATRRRA